MRFQQRVEEAVVFFLRHRAVDVVGGTLVVARGHVHARHVNGISLDDGADGIVEIQLLAPAQAQDFARQRVRGQRPGCHNRDRSVLVDGRDLLAHHADEGIAFDGSRYRLGKFVAVHRERVPGRNGGLARDVHQQRTRAAHLLFQQPRRGVLRVGLQRVGADQFREVCTLVSGRRAQRPHLEQLDSDAAAGALPGGLRAGQSGTDDANGVGH